MPGRLSDRQIVALSLAASPNRNACFQLVRWRMRLKHQSAPLRGDKDDLSLYINRNALALINLRVYRTSLDSDSKAENCEQVESLKFLSTGLQ